MDLTAYYPVLIIVGVLLLFIVVIVGAFLVGKRKYNADHGIVKEKKVKEKKGKDKKAETDVKLSEKDAAAVAAFNKSRGEGTEDNKESEKEVKPLKEEAARNKKVIEGPIIIVDENEPAEEEIIEWKPPAEENKNAVENEEPAAVVIPEKPAGNEWDDEDLELFEARTYAFDEETQSGYMKERERKTESEEEDLSFVYRERREQNRDPADDEGVQVFETFEKEEPAPPKAEEPKINNSKYAYFDSVMEKDKAQNEKTEWQPPRNREETPAAEDKSEGKPKKSMQYIELDLDEK